MGKTMDADIDNMVVKSKKESDHVRNLIEVFSILKADLYDLSDRLFAKKYYKVCNTQRKIMVYTEFLLKKILSIVDLSNRLSKLAIEV